MSAAIIGVGATLALGGTLATGVAVGGLAAGAVSYANSSKNAKNASNLAGQAGQASQVDIGALNDQVVAQSKANAQASRDLEMQLTPEVAKLRTQGNENLLSFMNQGQDPAIQKGHDMLASNLGVPINSPLLNAAIAKAQSDLALGGKLSQDQQNEAARKGGAQAGTVAPGGNLGLARDLTARDLGLTSYGVEQQRLQNASTIGGQELGMKEFDANNLLNSLSTLQSIHNNQFNQTLAAAQYGQSIAPPEVGLSPTAVANIAIGNKNATGAALANQANIAGNTANNQLGAAGSLAGYGLNAITSMNRSPGTTQTVSNTAQAFGGGAPLTGTVDAANASFNTLPASGYNYLTGM